MKRFLLRAGIFLAILVIGNLLVAASVLWPEYYGRYLQDFDRLEARSYTVVLLADSHGGDVPQDALDRLNIINLGEGSDNYADMHVKLRWLLRNDTPITTILLSADGHLTRGHREVSNNRDRSVLLATTKDALEILDMRRGIFWRKKYIEPYLPVTSSAHGLFLRKYLSGAIRPNKPLQPDWVSMGHRRRSLWGQQRFENHYQSGTSEDSIQDLTQLVEYAESKGIGVVGIQYPLTEEYLEHASAVQNLSWEVFNDFGYPVLDFRAAFSGRPALFRNPDHLNREGQQLFGELLVRNLLPMLAP